MPEIVYSVTIINEQGERTKVEFQSQSFRNLMELIVNVIHEDIGDCRGKGWCGTCHGSVLVGQIDDELNIDEQTTLGQLANTVATSRLACQIMVDHRIDGLVFKMLGDA